MKGKSHAIFAQAKGGPKLWFDGSKFSNNGSPKLFGDSNRAYAKAKELLRRFGGRNGILHRYRVFILPAASVFKRDGRKSNPGGLDGFDLDAAARKFEDFTGHRADKVIETTIKTPRKGLVIGELDLIGYRVKREGVEEGRLVPYGHQFSKKSRPLLAVSEDGKQLLIVGGRYEFTEAGIEDR